jgi:cobalt-zinc-cadmium efflux system outer membrane protein
MLRQLSRSPPPPYVAWILPVLAIMLLSGPAAAEAPVSLVAPGATLDEVLAIARRLSPDLAARALDTEAAQARVAIVGSLADPMLRITSDEIDRTSGPRQNKMLYTVEQEFPLWGKLDLRRDQASADVARSRADTRVTEAELIEKVKVAFAQYYQADQAIRTTEDLHRVVHDMARVARDRYAQGRGAQQEVYKAEVEITRLATEIVRLEAKRRTAAARLNALLARPIDAPLARPVKLRTLPVRRSACAGRFDATGTRRQSLPCRPGCANRRRRRWQTARRQELVSGRDVEGRRDRSHRQRPERLHGGDRFPRSAAMGPA